MACVHEYSFSFHMPFSLFIYSEHGRIDLVWSWYFGRSLNVPDYQDRQSVRAHAIL